MKFIRIFILFLLLYIISGCTVDDDVKIIPIAEGNYWVYDIPSKEDADTLHYETFTAIGPDSLGDWFWVCWSSYEEDGPFILAKNKPEGYCMNWTYTSGDRAGMYDLWGRKTKDPLKAVNFMFTRDEDIEYILYKYPIELDEEWIITTMQHTNENGEYICDYYEKGKYDLSTTVQVQAGKFSVMRYQYFLEGPPEFPQLNQLLQRLYCKPGIGEIIYESYYDIQEPINWEIIDELIEYHVD